MAAWHDGIDRLIERGVTGRILLGNIVPGTIFSVSTPLFNGIWLYIYRMKCGANKCMWL